MILPRDVLTKHKIRDAGIVNEWLSGVTQEVIAQKHGFTRQAIYSIIRKNRPAFKLDIETEKYYRIHELKNQLLKSGDSEKDRLEILEALRKECEGDEKGTTINNVTYNINGTRKNNRIEVLSTQSPASDS